jgi:saccharopine dehydrogenase (NAD+, L-lysine-forming)
MKILILGGASGDVGRALTRILVNEKTRITHLTITSRSIDTARKFVIELGDERVTALGLDVTDKRQLMDAMQGHNLIVNIVGPFSDYGIPVMKAAIESKVNYIDICDDIEPTVEALQLDRFAKDSGVFLLLCMGWFPGMSNLRVKALADQMDEVEEIVTAWVAGKKSPEDIPSKGLAGIEHYIKALTGKISTYREGHRIKIPAHQKGVTFQFPDPLGEYSCYQIEHPETATLPYVIPGVKTASTLGALYPKKRNKTIRFFTRLIDVKLFSIHLFIRISGMSMRSKKKVGLPTLIASYMSCIGKKNGKKGQLSYCEVNTKLTIAEATSQPLACAIFYIASGGRIEPGVNFPETALKVEDILRIADGHNLSFVKDAMAKTTWSEEVISLEKTT